MDNLNKLHYKLGNLIIKFGVETPKPKHGKMYNLILQDDLLEFQIDDYSFSIKFWKLDNQSLRLEETYIGIDFGGFDCNISEEAYKRLIGIIAISRWHHRKPI